MEGPQAPAGVRIESVSKRYRAGEISVTALDSVSLVVEPGSVVAVTGPSGSGKSTLLHVLGAMEAPDDGTIEVGDVELTSLSKRQQVAYRRRIGFVFQRFHLLPAMSAQDNVAAPLLPYRTSFDKHARARDVLAAVGLAGRERSLPSELSGGQQQRVAIARALVNDPVLLLADEPTGNLDSQTGTEIVDLLLDLRARLGMTVILATHDTVVASRSERIVRLLDGQVLDVVDVPPPVDLDTMLNRISRIEP
jgi:putative ABC transport system ATP-binding protein